MSADGNLKRAALALRKAQRDMTIAMENDKIARAMLSDAQTVLDKAKEDLHRAAMFVTADA